MGRFILKIEDLYFEYSTVSERPESDPMPLDAFRSYYGERHGSVGLEDLKERLERVEAKGTSSFEDGSWKESVLCNRAGKGEEYLTPSGFMSWVREFRTGDGLGEARESCDDTNQVTQVQRGAALKTPRRRL